MPIEQIFTQNLKQSCQTKQIIRILMIIKLQMRMTQSRWHDLPLHKHRHLHAIIIIAILKLVY
jgi:hypothetical protein